MVILVLNLKLNIMANLTEDQIKKAQEYSILEAKYGLLRSRRSTNGEAGLTHKIKKARKEISKIQEEFKTKWGLKIYGTYSGKVCVCTFEEYEEEFGED